MSTADQYIQEKYTPDLLGKLYADHISNENGEVLARVWETVEFKEVFDFNGGFDQKGLLKRRLEGVWRNTNPKTHLF